MEFFLAILITTLGLVWRFEGAFFDQCGFDVCSDVIFS